MNMDGTKTLRDYLLDPVESERLEAVRLLLSQVEGAARAMELMTQALKAKHGEDIDLVFDMDALRQHAAALSGYCFNHLVWLSVENGQDSEQVEAKTVAEMPAASELRH